ncbi:MAG: RNA ligase family protein [Vicinamibacterales bacterium]
MSDLINAEIQKYPRTPHLEGSRLQPGDEDLDAVPFSEICGAPVVVEEKIDGANAAISFDGAGSLRLQSRGHYLTGGPRERQFSMLKTWAQAHADAFLERFEDRYTVYGEWMHAVHSVAYDNLPALFLEFDILDRLTGRFLSTARRRELLDGLPMVSVPVLACRRFERIEEITELVGSSLFKSPDWRENFVEMARRAGVDPERALAQIDGSALAEGLYLKVEHQDQVTARLKWVRAGFLQTIQASGSHWADRPIINNRLAPGVDIFAPAAGRPTDI